MTELTLTLRGLASAAETEKQIRIEANRLEREFPHATPDAPIIALIRDLRITANALRDAADADAYEARAGQIRALAGERIRITWPNGGQRMGIAGTRTCGDHEVAALDGSLLTGELTPCIRIEKMVGRRYETVAEFDA